MSRGKKKFLIIFFSILSGIGLTYGILMLTVFLVDNYREKEYQEALDGIQVNNNLIYSSRQDSILYKSKEYTLSKYLGDNNCIEYICEDYIIYSKDTNQQYSYFSIDSKGESTLLFNSNVSLIWNFYKDGVFYLNHINDFYTYEFGFENVQSILEEDYIKRKEEDYKIVQINNTSLDIIDNHTGSSKKVLINDLKQNDTISKLSGAGLFISDYFIYGSYIYIVIYFNESRSIVAHYDFDLNEITVVGKALNGFWDYTFRLFYLENEVCLPLEALIGK
jgi:hypothetical protein